MINQRSLYASIDTMGSSARMLAKYRQVGDIVEAGFLPRKSAGSCAFTSLDFHRAVSQGSEHEWMRTAEKAKKSSSIWQTTLGQKGNSFGARQQLNFLSSEHTIKDKLFTRSLPEGKQQLLTAATPISSRDEKVSFEMFTPKTVAKNIVDLLAVDPKAYLRLNFDLIDDQGKGSAYGHTIAVCPTGKGDELYVMDPNVGVILTNKADLGHVLNLLQTKLYNDFIIADTRIETQYKFWLDPAEPLTREQIEKFRKEEEFLLNQVSLSDYEAYQRDQAKQLANAPDLDFDMDEFDHTEQAERQEAVFDEEGWENLPEIETDPNTTLILPSQYKSHLDEMKASLTPETQTDEWEMINKSEAKPK